MNIIVWKAKTCQITEVWKGDFLLYWNISVWVHPSEKDLFCNQIQHRNTYTQIYLRNFTSSYLWTNLPSSFYGAKGSHGECGVPYARKFPMPRPSLNETWWEALWYCHVTCRSCDLKVVSLVVMQLVSLTPVVTWYRYGFDYGSVHFVLMSTEHNFTQGSPQYKFLDQHMQGVNRSKTPWLIFAGHR